MEKVAAVGLIVENSLRGEAFFVTMLCVPKINVMAPFSQTMPFAVPALGRRAMEAASSADFHKALRPVLGEVLHFAQSLPGGMAVSGRLRALGEGVDASYAIQKKVVDDQWERSLERASSFAQALSTSLPMLASTSIERGRMVSQPGEMESPALVHFSAIAQSEAGELRQALADRDDAALAGSRRFRFRV